MAERSAAQAGVDAGEKMNQNLKNSIYGIILLGGGLYLGRMIGMTQTYMDTGKALTFSYFNGASTNLNTHITLLNLMHARDYEKVSGKLENLVDVDLIALSGYSAPPAPLKDDVGLRCQVWTWTNEPEGSVWTCT